MQNISKRVEQLTKEMGITGKELGNLLNLKKSPLTDWKNGKSKPTLEQLVKMCEIFGLSADDLLGLKCDYTEDEKNLIKYYRTLDKNSQNAMLTLFNIKHNEGKSLTSKIG